MPGSGNQNHPGIFRQLASAHPAFSHVTPDLIRGLSRRLLESRQFISRYRAVTGPRLGGRGDNFVGGKSGA
jgi:hypothetical protein